jgi:hypothetical protein
VRLTTLDSDVTLIDDAYISGAEWTLETSTVDGTSTSCATDETTSCSAPTRWRPRACR